MMCSRYPLDNITIASSHLSASDPALREQSWIFEHMEIGAALVDARTGRFLKANRNFCEITGYAAEELLDRTFSDITHPDDILIGQECAQQMLAGQLHSYTVEKRCVRKDGQIIWLHAAVSSLQPANEEPGCNIAIISDITERKLAEESARHQFISDLSHKLRTPITTIKLYTSLLRNGPTDKRGKFLDALEQEVDRMITLVEEVLETSRIKADRSDFSKVLLRNIRIERSNVRLRN